MGFEANIRDKLGISLVHAPGMTEYSYANHQVDQFSYLSEQPKARSFL